MNTWIKTKSCSNLLGISIATIKRHCKQGKYITRTVQANGGQQYEILLSSLPAEAQARYHELHLQKEEDVESITTRNKLKLTMSDLQDPKVQKKLQIYQHVKDIPKGTDRDVVIKGIARREDKSERTIYRWIKEVQSWQHRSCSNKIIIQSSEGAFVLPKSSSFDPQAIKHGLHTYYQNQHNGRKAAYKKLQSFAKENELSIGDYTSFTRIINKIPEQVADWFQMNPLGWELKYTPKITREWLKTPVYTVLCGDQKVSDYLVYDPQQDQTYVMNFYLWMDCTSRAYTGLWPSFGPYNKYTCGYSLREACRILTPQKIFTDWGKPEHSKYVDSLVKNLQDANMSVGSWKDFMEEYGGLDDVERKNAQAGKPWIKPIENHMNIIERELKDRFIAGYRKRENDAWINKQRYTELKKLREANKLLTPEELLEVFMEILTDRIRKPMNLKESGTTIIPLEILNNGIKSSNRLALDDDLLDMIFLPSFERYVRQGVVQVKMGDKDLRRYAVTPEGGIYIRKNEKVRVHVDPFDPDAPATISHLESGDFICNAQRWADNDPDDIKELTRKIREQRKLIKWWRQAINDFFKETGVKGKNPALTTSKAAVTAKKAKKDNILILKPNKKAADATLDAMYENMGVALAGGM